MDLNRNNEEFSGFSNPYWVDSVGLISLLDAWELHVKIHLSSWVDVNTTAWPIYKPSNIYQYFITFHCKNVCQYINTKMFYFPLLILASAPKLKCTLLQTKCPYFKITAMCHFRRENQTKTVLLSKDFTVHLLQTACRTCAHYQLNMWNSWDQIKNTLPGFWLMIPGVSIPGWDLFNPWLSSHSD